MGLDTGNYSPDISPVFDVSFDQALHSLETQLDVQLSPISDSGSRSSTPDRGPDMKYLQHSSNLRAVDGSFLEADPEVKIKATNHFSVAPLFQSEIRRSRKARLTVDGSNLEQISDNASTSTTTRPNYFKTRHISSPASLESPRSATNGGGLQRSRFVNYGRQNRKFSTESRKSRTWSQASESPTVERRPSPRASPTGLPKLFIPENGRPPVAQSYSLIRSQSPRKRSSPVYEASPLEPLHIGSPIINQTSDFEAYPLDIQKQTYSSVEVLASEPLVSSFQSININTSESSKRNNSNTNLPILDNGSDKGSPVISIPPATPYQGRSAAIPKVEEEIITIAQYLEDSPAGEQPFDHRQLLANTFSQYPVHASCGLSSSPESSMSLFSAIYKVLRQPDTPEEDSNKRGNQRRKRRSSISTSSPTPSPLSSLTSPVFSETKSIKIAIHNSQIDTPASSVTSLVAHERQDSKGRMLRSCVVCANELPVSHYPIRPTMACRHPSHVCSPCLTSWVRSCLREGRTDNISCPDILCGEQLSSHDVKAHVPPETYHQFVHPLLRS